MAPVSKVKSERLDVRLPLDQKVEIEQAASELGMTVSSFILETVRRRARQVIREHTRIELSNRDRDRFFAALDDTDARPNAALLRAADDHKRLIG
jgi:uncharacterized protein (DUF1778 family)